MKEKNFISAVIYIHNNEQYIESFLNFIVKILREYFENYEIICVNDYSTDLSETVIKKAYLKLKMSDNEQLSIVNLSCFHGVEKAMNAGIDLAIGDYCFEFDSIWIDYQESQVMDIYWKALEGYDYVGAVPDKRNKISELYYQLFDLFSDQPYHMMSERFRITSRRILNKVSMMNKTVPYRKAVYSTSGLSSSCIKYHNTKNCQKNNKEEQTLRKELGIDVLFLFTSAGYKFSTVLTMLMGFTSLFMLFYAMFVYLTSRPVEGWTPTILFISFVSFGIFASMTIIIKYLQLLVNLIFRQNEYSVLRIEKLSRDGQK